MRGAIRLKPEATVNRDAGASAATKDRLINAAAALFAERGFDNVTVREICSASQANVAAVNYHFGDKAGLYRSIVMHAIQVMLETNELSQKAGAGLSPEDQIREFVKVFVRRLTSDGPSNWNHKLMAREMEHPTEALDLVMNQVVRPRLDYLSSVAGAIMALPPDDPRVRRSVASLQGQCLMAVRKVPSPLAKTWGGVAQDLDGLMTHIAEFSIGGMRAIGQRPPT